MQNKKKILIDSLALLSPFTGIGRYTYENASQISLLKKDEFECYYFYGYVSRKLVSNDHLTPVDSFVKQIKSLIVKNGLIKKIARKILLLYGRLIQKEYDLYWQPNFIPLEGIKAKKIVSTVHDFSFYLQPEWHPSERLDYFNKHFWSQVKQSDWLITGSNFSKQEIIEYLEFDANKITVIYHGVDHDLYKLYHKDQLEEFKRRQNLPDKFILFVGSIEPRKNLLTLLKACAQLNENKVDNIPLVLVGFKGWENDEIMQIINQNKKNIIYLGYLSDIELAYIYNLAQVFVYPTLYEGFGIPPLEAMACGTPVITSDTASLPEVGGDAVLYVDPYDINDISQKLDLLLSSQTMQKDLIEKGLRRAKDFTWEKAAKEHIKVFEKVLKG